jgi:hypothetical protein
MQLVPLHTEGDLAAELAAGAGGGGGQVPGGALQVESS